MNKHTILCVQKCSTRVFCVVLSLVMKKEFPTITQRIGNYGKSMLCIKWDQLGFVYYKLLKSTVTIWNWSEPSRKNAASITSDITKLLGNTNLESPTPSDISSPMITCIDLWHMACLNSISHRMKFTRLPSISW